MPRAGDWLCAGRGSPSLIGPGAAPIRPIAAEPSPHFPARPFGQVLRLAPSRRVHPGHARKFAAKLESLGYPYLYFENTFGGHSNDADPEMNARRWAFHYVYLAQKLMD